MPSHSTRLAIVSSKRSDVQRLRGVAVSLVILSHLPTGLKLSGGFVGVDIFFVISGFVITRMLLIQESTSLKRRHLYRQFMASRFSRLVPPLAGMISGSILMSILFAPTSMLHQISASALLSDGFLSNFYFLRYFDSYWNPNILRNPFLHTWSLGVEFQVYLVLPLFLLGIMRKMTGKHKKKMAIVGLAAASVFSGSAFIYLLTSTGTLFHGYVSSSVAFYSPFTRFWEFGVGCISALLVVNRSPRRTYALKILRPLGWTALFWGTFVSNRIGELNLSVIPLCVGTGVLLGIGELSSSDRMEKFLSLTPMKWIGDRSYSIYLWHWPLLASASWIYPGRRFPALVFLVASFPIASLSYHYLERSRSRRLLVSVLRQSVPLVLSAILISVGFNISSSNWYRLPQKLSTIATSFPGSSKTGDEMTNAVAGCSVGESEIHCKNFPLVTKEIVIIGDSLAWRSFPAVQLAAREHGLNASVFMASGCSIELDSCNPSYIVGNLIYDYLAKADIVGLLVATNYDRESNRLNTIEGDLGRKPLCNQSKSTKDCQLHKDKTNVFETRSRAGLAQLHAYSGHILVALPFPQQAYITSQCLSEPLYRRILLVRDAGESCGRTSVQWQAERQGFYPEIITKVSRERPFVELWNPIDYLCDNGWCPAVINGGEQLMSDGIHWTIPGSRFLYPVFNRFIESALAE